jgi:NDP-sugar pyrophosphorylase family protein
MKIDTVFIIGPSEQLHPLALPKFQLPFLNVPLLNLSVNYLTPISSKMFIVCLENQIDIISQMMKDCKVSFEIISTSSYEGMAYILNTLHNKITTEYFILNKGDIYGQEPLKPMIEGFILSNDDIYASVERTNINGLTMSLDPLNRLVGFNEDRIPFIKNFKMRVSTEFVFKDFFIIRKSSIGKLDQHLYGFKSNVIPHLIKNKVKIRVGENSIFQVKNFRNYVMQIDFKNTILGLMDGTEYNLVDSRCEISEEAHIENSIIGTNAIIEGRTTVSSSIIMKNSILKENQRYERCVVDSNNKVYKY